jgi:excisionase family DNA binding protein
MLRSPSGTILPPPPPGTASDPLLTIKELAAYLRLNERTVLKLAGEGALPGMRIGNQWRFRRRIVDAWLDDQIIGVSPTRIRPRRTVSLAAAGLRPDWPTGDSLPRTFALADCLAPEQIIPALEATTAMGVVEELATRAERLGLVRDRTWFTGALIARENILSTGIGHGVAFPHTARRHPEEVTRPFLLIGRSLKGVDFHAPDAALVKLFFVLGLRYDELHLPWLAKLSRLLASSGLLDALLEAPDASSLYDRLVAAERVEPGKASSRHASRRR